MGASNICDLAPNLMNGILQQRTELETEGKRIRWAALEIWTTAGLLPLPETDIRRLRRGKIPRLYVVSFDEIISLRIA
jgi:hypothetical protein